MITLIYLYIAQVNKITVTFAASASSFCDHLKTFVCPYKDPVGYLFTPDRCFLSSQY